jgi:GntR family transcriptional regulator, gluconate operon transcriptional repressor
MAAIEHKQLWEAVADQLRDEILDGSIPAGARLVEKDLADRYGVSRGPIRDALTELSRVGLAEDIPRRGTFVRSLTEQDLAEVYMIRRAIEEAAVRLAVEHATDDDLAEMYQALEETERAYAEGDLAAAWEADMAFHRTYCRMSANGRLLTLFDDMASQTVLLMRTRLTTHASLGWIPPVDVHRQIADAIRARDGELAADAVGRHYQYTQDRLRASASAASR